MHGYKDTVIFWPVGHKHSKKENDRARSMDVVRESFFFFFLLKDRGVVVAENGVCFFSLLETLSRLRTVTLLWRDEGGGRGGGP